MRMLLFYIKKETWFSLLSCNEIVLYSNKIFISFEIMWTKFRPSSRMKEWLLLRNSTIFVNLIKEIKIKYKPLFISQET